MPFSRNRPADVRQFQFIHLVDAVIIRFVDKYQRENPGIGQVRTVDPGKGFGNDGLDTQIQGHQCGVLAGRTLPVVGAADDDPFAFFAAAGGEFLIAYGEAEIRQIGDIGTVGQDFGARRHDVVGGDVVPDLQQRLCRDGFRQRLALREFLDIGPAQDFDLVHLLHRGGRDDHVVVDEEGFRHGDRNAAAQFLRIGEYAGQGGSGGGFRADQIDLRVGCAGTAFKVAVERAQGHAAGIGGLPHADAGTAGGFEDPGPGGNEIGQRAVFGQHGVHLLGAGGDGQAHVRMDRLALEDGGDAHQIQIGGVGTRADAHLIDFDFADVVHGFDVVGHMRAGGQGL